ncbi:MAG: UDP-N-acetylmuramoyl-tripeptide--D-alanyl-D-alanine ligase [Rhodobacteraceae bacterium]|nr:UDP-N-acetylmuramoyl-tripeptide--D-alanyl-D-alanine ligase [Paracoccaceae bacterium]
MTALWTSADLVAATGGRTPGDWSVTGVSIDSRTVAPGDLFVALTDARDGHDFVADALDKGAAAALVSRLPDGVDPAHLLIVDDVLAALTRIAAAARARMTGKVIAVTGSVGKTTVKEMLRTVLSPQGRTHAAEASYNNHWGVPLTLARMPADTEFAVIEIGMNAPGEIAPLSRLAAPDLAMVTTVAAAHLEAFGALEGIAHEKASIFDGLKPGGLALAHADIDTAPILFDKARAMGARLIRFGEADGVEAQLTDLRLAQDATVVKARIGGSDRLFKIGAPGRHLAVNALIAMTVVDALGLDLAQAGMALAGWEPVGGRGTRHRIAIDPGSAAAIDLIDDAFNANPASVAAALDVLAASVPEGQGRRIAVLGDMLELGPDAPTLHAALADHPAMDSIDLVHTVGPLMEHLHAALPGPRRGQHRETATEMVTALPRSLRPGDVVLVKGSKGIKVSLVVDALRKLGQAAPEHGRGVR